MNNILSTLMGGALVLGTSHASGQASVLGHFGGPTNYLGWNAATLQPLDIRHDANQPIDFYTGAGVIQRMRLQPTWNYTIGTFITQVKEGALGLSPDGSLWNTAPGPFSRLHLHNGGAAYELSYRPWMHNGITFTTDLDQMYIGHKIESGPEAAAVIQWGDNATAPNGPDVLKFIFTSDYTGSAGSGDMDGRELGRFHPGGHLGLGDYAAASLQPDERLDLLDKTIRLRNFMTSPPIGSGTDYESTTLENVLVVDPADGRVYWRDMNNWNTCDWEINANDDVVTAYLPGPPTGCPGETNMVGIGQNNPRAKLDVEKTIDNGFTTEVGIRSDMNYTATTKVALEGVNLMTATDNFGLRASVDGAEHNWGVASFTGAITNGSVVSGYFRADGEYITKDPIGVWGVAVGDPSGGLGWAGWFDGYTYCTLGLWSASDAQLKDNVAPLTDAMDKLLQLHPKSYTYKTADFPTLGLDNETHFGVIAQELETVFPELVRDAEQPAVRDDQGNEVHAAVPFKSVNPEGLIPWLIAGMQEQQATIAEQNARLDALEQDLAACCESRSMIGPGGGHGDSQSTGVNELRASDATDQRLTITPNPFSEGTVIGYTLPKAGMVSLQVSDGSGKALFNLFEGQQTEGTQRYDWNTSFLAPGMYHVTLLVDGQPLVKKAVKVAR